MGMLARLDVFSIFGSAKVVVPAGTRVVTGGVAIFGSAKVKSDSEVGPEVREIYGGGAEGAAELERLGFASYMCAPMHGRDRVRTYVATTVLGAAGTAPAPWVAAGTVYSYFRSEDELPVSPFERTRKDAIAEGRAALVGATDPRERLSRIARLHLERLGRDRDLAVVFQVELRQSTKFMERFSSSYLREYLGLIREAVEAGQAEGLFRRDVSATAASKILFGALDEMATNWMLSRRRYPLENDADTVIDLFLHGVGDRTRPVGGVA